LGADTLGNLRDVADVIPELSLGGVLLFHRQEHHGDPPQHVLDDDHLVIFVDDVGGFLASDDAAEDAVRRFSPLGLAGSGVFLHGDSAILGSGARWFKRGTEPPADKGAN
jgi:hypothetical protein